MELENAVKVLWKNGVYAESGMGCTGPILMVNEEKLPKAVNILSKEGYISRESNIQC
jgi:type III secretory pathway lipoprotein EscJ